MQNDIELQKELLLLKEREILLQEGLPFLHGWKWYKWAREFYESRNKLNFLVAANQISKSSTQIRKVIHWSTAPELWHELWPNYRKGEPIQFWYLYPTNNQCKIEFDMKWKQFLPNGRFKEHPVYGWKEEYSNKQLFAIHFNSGAHIFFKTYAQNVTALQTGTCHGIFTDEELPVELYEELIFRISASEGYFHMVFTATLGQEYWRQVMDPGPRETELLPHAFKQTISMYDCLVYDDGSATPWTLYKIKTVENRCNSHSEILKRVHGKFIKLEGQKYPTFNLKRHINQTITPIPKSWYIYAGVDIGSGGETNHPSAICFVAVRPDYQAGRVFLGWRGDKIQTTAGDVVEQYIKMRKEHKIFTTQQFYDFSCKDFDTIATRMNEPFQPAEKGHEKGEGIINTLFKNDMLMIDDTLELQKLCSEIPSIREGADKRHAKDDFTDALRYAVALIPWDFSWITSESNSEYVETGRVEVLTPMQREIQERRGETKSHDDESIRMENEFMEINELYEGY